MADEPVVNSAEPEPEEAMVAAWSSQNHDAEMEALAVQGVLEANGVPAMLVGPSVLPNLEFQVQVPEHLLNDAQRLLAEARESGPEAAVEAEAASENTSSGGAL